MDPYFQAYLDPEEEMRKTQIQGYTPPPVQQQPNRLRQYGQAALQGGVPGVIGEAMGQRRPYGSAGGALKMLGKMAFGG